MVFPNEACSLSPGQWTVLQVAGTPQVHELSLRCWFIVPLHKRRSNLGFSQYLAPVLARLQIFLRAQRELPNWRFEPDSPDGTSTDLDCDLPCKQRRRYALLNDQEMRGFKPPSTREELPAHPNEYSKQHDAEPQAPGDQLFFNRQQRLAAHLLEFVSDFWVIRHGVRGSGGCKRGLHAVEKEP